MQIKTIAIAMITTFLTLYSGLLVPKAEASAALASTPLGINDELGDGDGSGLGDRL